MILFGEKYIQSESEYILLLSLIVRYSQFGITQPSYQIGDSVTVRMTNSLHKHNLDSQLSHITLHFSN